MNDYTFYIVAGIATSPDFFTELAAGLKEYYSNSSRKIEVHTIYPYGDRKSRIAAQINRVLFDYKRADRSYGAKEVRRYILEHYNSGKIVILGHSAGGIAGYHAIPLLEGEGLQVYRVIQIGSAKVRISREYLGKTAYIKASINADFITRLGSWGPYWNRCKYAPKYRWDVDMVGGHTDYFRNHQPFMDQKGISNLSKTLNIIIGFLDQNQYNEDRRDEHEEYDH